MSSGSISFISVALGSCITVLLNLSNSNSATSIVNLIRLNGGPTIRRVLIDWRLLKSKSACWLIERYQFTQGN